MDREWRFLAAPFWNLREPYQPLDQGRIRLLVLEPGQLRHPIHCHVIPVTKISQTKYEALSYTWGRANKTHSLMCNGRYRAITQNLFDAMQDLRYIDKIRVLWIDALCINQEDDYDRTIQVRLMKKIYEAALRVLIWLGPTLPARLKAIDLVDNLDLASDKLKGSTMERDGLVEENDLIEAGLPNFENSIWEDAKEFFDHPWFSRAWVFQEAVMARDSIVICGTRKTQWSKLANACDLLLLMLRHPLSGSTGLGCITSIQNCRLRRLRKNQEVNCHQDLLGLLITQRRSLASDNRDKVFAFVGLESEIAMGYRTQNQQPTINIDYTASLTEVYKCTALSLAKEYGDVRFLSAAGSLQAAKHMLPSWVPDWNVPQKSSPLMGLNICNEYNASGSRSQFCDDCMTIGDGSKVCDIICCGNDLTLTGVLFDYAKVIGPALHRSTAEKSTEDVPVLMEWMNMVERHYYKFQGNINPALAHWQTIRGDRVSSPEKNCSEHSEHQCDCFDVYLEFMRRARGIFTFSRPGFSQEKLDTIQTSQERIVNFCIERSFFITEGGHMGMGPGDMNPGDMVCLVQGASAPLILRPFERRFIGDGIAAVFHPRDTEVYR